MKSTIKQLESIIQIERERIARRDEAIKHWKNRAITLARRLEDIRKTKANFFSLIDEPSLEEENTLAEDQ